MKRKLKTAVAMLALFSVVGVTGEAAGPKKPLNDKLAAKDVKSDAKKIKTPKSWAVPNKVVKQLNKTNKRVNEIWYDVEKLKNNTEAVEDLAWDNAKDIEKNTDAITEEGKIRQAIDKTLGDTIKYETIARKEADKKHDEAIEAEKNRRALADTRLAYEIGGNRTNINKLTKEVEARKEADERQDKAIAANSSAIKHLDRKVNKGTSMLVAMSNVDFQDVNAGEVAVGAGVGHYVGDQAVAVGVAYGVNDDLKIHAKWSGVAGDPHYNAIGGGVTYKFRTR
ncbi:MAG: YadA C-terminal domain-containing protein [Fusobacterium necrophorum]|nr:YadA C-terminal domain-containing protein [Fusobacterium necrophorum]